MNNVEYADLLLRVAANGPQNELFQLLNSLEQDLERMPLVKPVLGKNRNEILAKLLLVLYSAGRERRADVIFSVKEDLTTLRPLI